MPFPPFRASGVDRWLRLKFSQVFCGFMHELWERTGVQLWQLKERICWKAVSCQKAVAHSWKYLMWLEVRFDDIIPTFWPTTYIRKHVVCTVHNIQADVADKVQWIQHKGSTTNLILLLNFLVVTTKSAWSATGKKIEKQLCCTARTVIINEDCIWVVVAKNATLSKSSRKWNLHFYCREKMNAVLLFCFSVWSYWFCLKLCLSFFMQCINVHTYS